MDKRIKDQPEYTENEKSEFLINAIFMQALNDACCYRHPRSPDRILKRSKKTISSQMYRFLERERLSYCARQFINRNNTVFIIYCDLLNIEPEYLEKKLWQKITKFDQEL